MEVYHSCLLCTRSIACTALIIFAAITVTIPTALNGKDVTTTLTGGMIVDRAFQIDGEQVFLLVTYHRLEVMPELQVESSLREI